MDGLFNPERYEAETPPPADESADRKRTRKRNALLKAGRHPVTNGSTHPELGTCGDCDHHVAREWHRRMYHKCGLVPVTNGAGSDIRLSWPACDRFEPETVELRRSGDSAGS